MHYQQQGMYGGHQNYPGAQPPTVKIHLSNSRKLQI